MNKLYQILICFVVAIPASGFYSGWAVTGMLNYQLNLAAACAFTLTALMCVLLAQQIGHRPIRSKQARAKTTNAHQAGKRQQGEVKWFNGNKGFGFITRDSGGDIFVHFRSVQKSSKRLSPGKRVEFIVVTGKKGEEAEDVVVI